VSVEIYALQSVLYGAVGIVAGFIVGYIARDTHYRRRSSQPMHEPPAQPVTGWRRYVTRIGFSHILGTLVVALALVSTLLLSQQAARYNRASDCLASYTETYSAVLKERDAVNARGRQDARQLTKAERQMWETVLANAPTAAGQQPTQAQRDASIEALRRYFASSDAYLAALDRTDQARLQYPVPSNLCPKPRDAPQSS
jgi:hypothetical protein